MHSTTGGKPVWRFVNLHNNGRASGWGVDRISGQFGKAAMQTTARPWPRVTWDVPTLERVAQAVRLINPHVVYDSDDSAASYIRGTAERELYRLNPEHGTLVATGGWEVVFVAGDKPGHFTAWPAVTAYAVLRFAKERG